MEFNYSREECNRFNGATGILERVVGICSHLLYNNGAIDEDEKATILAFEEPYAIMRAKITMDDIEDIDWIYREVKPLIIGDKPKLTLDYILTHTRTWKDLLKAV
jgi:hypothetical protein